MLKPKIKFQYEHALSYLQICYFSGFTRLAGYLKNACNGDSINFCNFLHWFCTTLINRLTVIIIFTFVTDCLLGRLQYPWNNSHVDYCQHWININTVSVVLVNVFLCLQMSGSGGGSVVRSPLHCVGWSLGRSSTWSWRLTFVIIISIIWAARSRAHPTENRLLWFRLTMAII